MSTRRLSSGFTGSATRVLSEHELEREIEYRLGNLPAEVAFPDHTPAQDISKPKQPFEDDRRLSSMKQEVKHDLSYPDHREKYKGRLICVYAPPDGCRAQVDEHTLPGVFPGINTAVQRARVLIDRGVI